MGDLHKALSRYWSWVEKALFAFAFIASVTVVSDFSYEDTAVSSSSLVSTGISSTQPWPVISAVSNAIGMDDPVIYEDDDSDLPANTTMNTATDLPSRTISSATRAVSATATNLLRRQLDSANHTSTGSGGDTHAGGLLDDDEWPGYENWTDGYSTGARWAAIGILIGIVIAVWLPWLIFTVKVNRTVCRN